MRCWCKHEDEMMSILQYYLLLLTSSCEWYCMSDFRDEYYCFQLILKLADAEKGLIQAKIMD